MIQPIYTSVSNAQTVSCGPKRKVIKSEPIPLFKENYFKEFRTELEKAKARANLGIGDAYTLQWGNIKGRIEDNADLTDFIKNQWTYYYKSQYSDIVINNVKEALDYVLYYVQTFESNDALVSELQGSVRDLRTDLGKLNDDLTELINQKQEQTDLSFQQVNDKLTNLDNDISSINDSIATINDAIENIDVDKNIANWINANLAKSPTIQIAEKIIETIVPKEPTEEDPSTEETLITIEKYFDLKISKQENNAVQVLADGLYVEDLSGKLGEVEETANTAKTTADENAEAIKDINGKLIYDTNLPESTESTSFEGLTVGQIKDKTLSEILDDVLFPPTVRDLVQPQLLLQGTPNNIIEFGSQMSYPVIKFVKGDAGEINNQSIKLLKDGQEVYAYSSIGNYSFVASVSYDDGEYLLNNRNEETTKRIDAGTLTFEYPLVVTYPWYAGNEDGLVKQQLVPFGQRTDELDFDLSSYAKIMIPGEHSEIMSLRVNAGLGFLDVNEHAWTKEENTILNGVAYQVWTKNEPYYTVLPHKIILKLEL